MNDFIMINEKNPPMENGYHNGVSKNGQANGLPKAEIVNGVNAKGAIELQRPIANVNSRPAATVKEQRAQLRGIGVVGLGYWGPNWVRNLHQSQAARRIVACDLDQKRRTARQPIVLGPRDHQSLRRLAERR